MYTRHFLLYLLRRYRPIRLEIWSQIIVWGSLLISLPAWAVPQTAATTNSTQLNALPRVDRDGVALAPLSSPPTSAAAVPPQGAAALLPLHAIAATAQLQSDPLTSVDPPTGATETIAQTESPAPQREDGPSQQPVGDPELGILRIQPASDNAPGAAAGQSQVPPSQQRCRNPDPEFGCLFLKPLPPPPPPHTPSVYLIARFDYFRSSNVFSAVDPVDDGLVRPGFTLFAAPALGPDTYFVGSIDGNLVRYNNQPQINYNELRLRAGIFQRLSPTMFGEFGWSNQQLFISGDRIPGLPSGTRFLNDHGIRLELSRRDQLGKRLSLSTFYQLRVSFADPDTRSRILNSLIASLSYDIQPNLQVGLDYQFALANFTAINRDDQYHQIAARLTYTAFRSTQFNLFVGYSFGDSTDPTIDFNSLILGVSVTVNLGLF